MYEQRHTNLTLFAEKIILSGISRYEIVGLDARCISYEIKSEENVLRLVI